MAKTKIGLSAISILFWLFTLSLALLSIESLQDNTLISKFIAMGLFGLILVFMDRGIFKSSFPKTISIVLLAFAALSLASTLWAYNRSESLAISARVFTFIPVFFILWYQLQSKRLSRDELLKGVVVFAAAAVLPTLVQLLQGMQNGAFIDDIYVITGRFSHKNLLTSALMLSFPFCLVAWAILKGAWSRIAMILSIIMVFEMFVLRTRGVWLALFGAAIISGLSFYTLKPQGVKLNRNWLIGLSAAAVLILTALFLSPSIKAGFTSSSNIQKRLAFWDNSMEMIQEHPVSGVGAGNWKLVFPKYGLEGVDNSVMQGQTHIQRPHNDYLWVWAELGPLGLLLYVSIFVLTFIRLWRNLNSLEEKEDRILHLGVLFGLSGLAIFSFSDFPLERAPHTFFLMLFAAIAFSKDSQSSWKGLGYLLPLMLFFAIIVNGIRFNLEQEAKTMLEIDYSGATLGQRMAGQNQQAISREISRISTELIEQTELVYDETFFTVDNYAMPVKYFEAKGRLYGGSQDLEMVKQVLGESMKSAPYNILNYQLLAEYYARKGQTDSAMAKIDEALRISPQFNALILKKAEILIGQNRHLDALAVLNLFPFQQNDQRYINMLTTCLVKVIQTYPAEHQRYQPMMQYMGQFDLNSNQKLIAVYRRYRTEKTANQLRN